MKLRNEAKRLLITVPKKASAAARPPAAHPLPCLLPHDVTRAAPCRSGTCHSPSSRNSIQTISRVGPWRRSASAMPRSQLRPASRPPPPAPPQPSARGRRPPPRSEPCAHDGPSLPLPRLPSLQTTRRLLLHPTSPASPRRRGPLATSAARGHARQRQRQQRRRQQAQCGSLWQQQVGHAAGVLLSRAATAVLAACCANCCVGRPTAPAGLLG